MTEGQVFWLPFIKDLNDHSPNAAAVDDYGLTFHADVVPIPGRVRSPGTPHQHTSLLKHTG